MGFSTLGKVCAGIDVALGGVYGYRAIKDHGKSSDAQERGAKNSASALHQRSMFTAVTAVGFAATGAIELATHGEAAGGMKWMKNVLAGVMFAGVGGNLVTRNNVVDGQHADAQIAQRSGQHEPSYAITHRA